MNKSTKYFLGISIFTVLTIIITGIIGSNQKKENSIDFIEYTQFKKDVSNGKNIDKALKKVNEMQDKDKDNYIFNIDKANIYSQMKEYDKAQNQMQEALLNNKKLNNDPKFIIDYAEIALENKNYSLCEKLLNQAMTLEITQEQNKKIDNITSKLK